MTVHETDVDPEEVARLTRDFLDAIEDEKDAASRAASLADELEALGVDPRPLDSRP